MLLFLRGHHVKYVELYTEAQKEARTMNKGLWGVEEIAEKYQVGIYEFDPSTSLPIDRINLNTATNEELQLIPGVGETLATRIIEYRSNHLFTNVEDLVNVKGIGQKSLQKLLPYITIE
jgi:comEA protein